MHEAEDQISVSYILKGRPEVKLFMLQDVVQFDKICQQLDQDTNYQLFLHGIDVKPMKPNGQLSHVLHGVGNFNEYLQNQYQNCFPDWKES